MKIRLTFLITVFLVGMDHLQAQYKYEPKDVLTKDFHANRREAVRAKLSKNSVAVFFANPVRNRANDVDYVYHQDPDLYYLTGYKEPNATLLIFSEPVDINGKQFKELFFVQPRSEQSEMWNGERLGIERTKERTGIEGVFANDFFDDLPLDFKSFDKVLMYELKGDVRDNRNDEGDLYSMMQYFKEVTDYPEADFSETEDQLYTLIETADEYSAANVAKVIGRAMENDPSLAKNETLKAYQNASTLEERTLVVEKLPKTNIDLNQLHVIMGALREVKLEEEISMLKKAVRISAMGQVEVMKAMHPGMSEREVQGIHEFVFKKYGAEFEGYPSIVGGGHNGCVLHYIENNKPQLTKDEMILMDLGAEYRGYTADVTRTIPVNGKFSKEQKAIYEIVYKAQEAGIQACQVGEDFSAPYIASVKEIKEGLMKLGIIKTEADYGIYLPHGVSHHIGLDVHDKSNYSDFQENMVITVEPGIYIPENSPCDPKWWGIAVRIEDDILITSKGPVNLSEEAPRHWKEIEKVMKQESVLEKWELPVIE
ncbi:aminopeptidase P family protein [Algivirga pacifica]|uniref:Xaa-Pro aminopeptidase n=1 Tax=Algivirga pacifica TaxID=1162670 RepID=A0ABP9CXW1_9BACT